MQFGYYTSGAKTYVLDASIEPTLLIRARETFHRMFLDYVGHKAFFGSSKPLLPYLDRYVLFDGSPIPFNPLEGDPYLILEACKAVWDYGATVQVDKDFLMAIMAMKETKGTLFQLPYLFISDTFRTSTIGQLKDPVLKHYWTYYSSLPPRDQAALSAPILNRLMPLVADKDIRRIISSKASFDTPKTLIVDVKNPLLSALVMANFDGVAFIETNLHVGHSTPIMHIDYLDQLTPALQSKMLNTSTLMVTRLGALDADTLTPHFDLVPDDYDITELPRDQAYVRLDKTRRVFTFKHARPRLNKPPIPLKISPDLDDKIERFISGL
jgi:hypothetical protein